MIILQFSRSVLLAALALPVLAQDPAARTAAPAAQRPVLVLKTSKVELATMVAMRFEYAAAMPTPPANGHFVLSLGADRKVKVDTGAGDVGMLDLVGDPGALMDIFAEDIQGVQPMVQGAMTLALQAQGMSPKEVAALVKNIFDFPKQVQQLTLTVVGDPETAPQDGLDITLALEPKAGAGFAGFVDALQPSAQGAPLLGSADAMIRLQCALAPDGMAKVFASMRDWAISMSVQGAEQRQRAGEIYDRFIKLYDGGISASFGENFQGQVLMGVLDVGKLQQLMASDEYLAVMKAQKLPNRDAEVQITPNVFEHRGVKVMKSAITGLEPNPLMPDGAMESFIGAAANCMFITFGGKEVAAKATIDAIADQKVKRVPLSAGALLDMKIDLKAIAAVMHGGGVNEDMPSKMVMSLGKRGKALTLHVHVQ